MKTAQEILAYAFIDIMVPNDVLSIIEQCMEEYAQQQQDDWIEWSEIESYAKVYNHEKSGEHWSVNSFLMGLRNWLKQKS